MTNLGDMAGMLKKLREMQGELAKAQKELAKETVTAEAGNGAVRVTVTGDQRVTSLEIDNTLINPGDTQKLAKLMQDAMNRALDDSREMAKKKLGPLSAGLGM